MTRKKTKPTNGHVNGLPAAMLPVYPGIAWGEQDYAKLHMRLDLFDDQIVATRFEDGQRISHCYIVDPMDVAQAMGGMDMDTGYLPENILFWQRKNGQERIGVWIPPKVWSLRAEPTDRPNRTIPLPGFVFVGHGKDYSLWAVADDGRPGPQTPLYMAPVPNTSGGSRGVCQGNVTFPMASTATIWTAVAAFFESGFNSHLDNGKSKRHPNGVLKMWKTLDRARAQVYPVDDLLPVKVQGGSQLTLAKVIKGL